MFQAMLWILQHPRSHIWAVQNAIQEAKAKGYDLVIVDTAGRLAVDEEMMNEIAAIKKAINPDEIDVYKRQV